MKLRTLDLFAGIGGFSLGLEATGGYETVAFCEIEDYPRIVLAKHWPEVPIYDDVRQLTAERLASDGIGVDVITGGFPCQDISTAGNQTGIAEGTRSGLWSECARLIGELQPRWAIFENVPNLLNGERGDWFKRVLWDISQVGYDAEWHCIPASALGARHRRDRVWIICHPSTNKGAERAQQECEYQGAEKHTRIREDVAYTNSKRGRSRNPEREDATYAGQPSILEGDYTRGVGTWDTEPNVGRVANGVPSRAHRLRCLGNAVVPQIPELIGRAIMEHENDYDRNH